MDGVKKSDVVMSCPMINTSARPLRACLQEPQPVYPRSQVSRTSFTRRSIASTAALFSSALQHCRYPSSRDRLADWKAHTKGRVSNPVRVALEYHLHNATLLFLSFPPMTSKCRVVVVRWAECLVKLGPPWRIEYRLPRSVAGRVQRCHPRATVH